MSYSMKIKKISLVKKYARATIFTVGISLLMLFANTLLAGDIYEAETATLNGVVSATNATGFSGNGFVDYVNSTGDYVEWNVKLSNAGYYELEFQYALSSGNRPLKITVNGVDQQNLNFAATGDFSTWQATNPLTVKLSAGINRIRATAIGSSGGNIDYLSLTKVTNPNKNETISQSGTQEKSITLNNGKIIFQVNEANSNQVILSYQLAGKTHPAVKLIPTLKGGKAANVKFSIIKGNGKSQSGLLLITAGNRRGSLQFKLDKKSKYLKLSKLTGIDKLKLNFSSSALVIPEQSSEDLVIYPSDWKQNQVIIPGDNHLVVNMIDRGNATITCIWNNPNIRLVQHKTANGKKFNGIDLNPQAGDILWVGIDAAPHIWAQPTKSINKKATKIAWKPPFAAKWFVTLKKQKSDIEAENSHCDTWALANLNNAKPNADTPGIYIVNQDGRAFSAEIGMYSYPFIQKQHDIYLFYPEFRKPQNSYDNSFIPLIYTLKATSKTKKHKMLPYNALERTLAAKTLEQLHTVSSARNRHQATCGRTKQIEKIFYRDEAKKSQTKVNDYCEDMDKFILYHRQRIEAYRAWAKKISQELNTYAANHPNASSLTKSLRKDLAKIEQLYAKVKNVLKTPEYFQTLTDKIIKLTNSAGDSEAKENKCKTLGRQIRRIGGKQDHLTGTLRSVVKAFRIRITLLLLKKNPPELQKMLKKLRHETAVIMHTRLKMEGK
jgi:Carbohydrate binding module (family 35)